MRFTEQQAADKVDSGEPIRRIGYFRLEDALHSSVPLRLSRHVDGHLFTHLILGSIRLDASVGGLSISNKLASYLADEIGPFKRQYPHVRLLVSITNNCHIANCHSSSSPENYSSLPTGQTTNGTATGNGGFAELTKNPAMKQRFVRSTIEFLHKFQLDGIELDWRESQAGNYPFSAVIIPGLREHERSGLVKLVQSLREAFVENFYARKVSESVVSNGTSSVGPAMATVTTPTMSIMMNNSMSSSTSRQLASSSLNLSSLATVSKVEQYLLTMSLSIHESLLDSSQSQELRQIASLCDWFHVLSLDYYHFRAYAPFTGPITPLHPIVNPYVPILSKLSLSCTLAKLIGCGGVTESTSGDRQTNNGALLDRNKIVVAIPTYARAYRLMFRQTGPPSSFTLAIGTKLSLRNNSQQASQASSTFSQNIQSSDRLNYGEVCEILDKTDTRQGFDSRARVPYALADDGYTWITFENEQSVREKVRYVIENQLAGYMSYDFNSDLTGPNELNEELARKLSSPLQRAMFTEVMAHQNSSRTEQNQKIVVGSPLPSSCR